MKKNLLTRKRFTNLIFSMFILLLGCNVSLGQTTVFNETFTGNPSAAGATSFVTTGSTTSTVTGATSYTAYDSALSGFFSALTGVSAKDLNNTTSSANASPNFYRGTSTISGALSALSSPFNSTLNANKGIVTWTFNIKNDKSSPQNPLATAFTSGGATAPGVVLVTDNSASSNISAASITTKGWAVVMTQGVGSANGNPNRLDLGYFDAGLTNSGFHSILNTGDLAFNASAGTSKMYYSVRVTYNPYTNAWAMSYRADASSATAPDPSDTSGIWVNASLTSGVATNVNTNATTSAMSNFMFYYNHNGSNSSAWDNFKVVVGEVVNTPSVASLSSFYYVEGAGPSTPQSFTFTTNTATIPTVTLPNGSNYEICNTVGGTYSLSPTITAVTPSSGIYTYTIYARLKAGLSAGSYTASENITISTSGSIYNKTVALSTSTVSAGADTTPPTAPGTFTLNSRTDTSLNLSWAASATTGADLTGYLLVRYTSNPSAETSADPAQGTTYISGNTYLSIPNSKVGTVVYAGSNLTFTDTNLTPGTNYYYKVYAYDLARNYSTASSDSPYTAKTRSFLATPVATTADVTYTGINANWQHVANASSYNLYLYTNPGTQSNIVGWTFPVTVTNSSITADIANANNVAKQFSLSTGTLSSAVGVTTNAASAGTFYNQNTITIPVKWFQVDANTTGYKTIKVSSSLYGNSTNSARDFKLQYSITGPTGPFTDVSGGAITCVSGSWVSLTDLALPAECENAANLSLRWMQASFYDISGSEMVSTSSTTRIDNIYVKGSALSLVSGYPVTFPVTGTPAVGDALSSAQIITTAGTYFYDVVANPGSGSSAYVSSLHSNLMSAVYIDNVPPANPGTVTVNNATSSSLAVNWVAASSIDGGGYTVVRYTTNPAANNDPTQKSTYVAGDTINNGDGSLSGTVVYVGTALTFSNTALSAGTTYYYKVYTFDQDHNYSDESSASGTTLAVTLTTPVASASTSPTETGFTANWSAVSNATNYNLYLYNANTQSNIVGWTFDTNLVATTTSTNNTTNTVVQSKGTPGIGTVSLNTCVTATTSAWLPTGTTPNLVPSGTNWEIQVNTLGYRNTTVSSKMYASQAATAARDFKVQYRIGVAAVGNDYADVPSSSIIVAKDWTTGVLNNLALPPVCDNQPLVYLRWINYTTLATDGVSIISNGGISLDDVYVKGNVLNLESGYPITVSGTSQVLTNLVPGVHYYNVMANGNGSNYLDSVKSNLITSSIVPIPQATADYKSTGDASTSSVTNWSYFDGTNWSTATVAPTGSNNITIATGTTVALGTDIVVGSGKTMNVNGTINLAGHVVSGTGSFVLSSGASLKLGDNTSLATAITATTTTLSTSANYYYDGTVAQHTGGLPGSVAGNPSAANGSVTYTATLTGNIIVSNTAGVTMQQAIKINSPGTLTVKSTGKLLFGDGEVASSTQNSGTLNSGSYNYNGTGNFLAETGSTLSITSSKGISSGSSDGNIRNSGTRTFNSGINFIFAKNDLLTPISIGTSFGTEINATTGINNLTINNPYGVFLASTYTTSLVGTANAASAATTSTYTGGVDITINGTLNIVSGKLYTSDYVTLATNSSVAVTLNSVDYFPIVTTVITPGSTITKTVTIGAAGSITGAGTTTGWVVGNLKKVTTSGNSPSFNYSIGDATNYYPLAVTFSGTTSADGGLTASTIAGTVPSISTSGLDATKKVNRYWSLTNSSLTGFGTYQATFKYAASENDDTTSASTYLVRRYDNATWSATTISGTPTTTTTIATGISGFGNFAIGKGNAPDAPTAEAQSFCSSSTVANLVATGTSINWYSSDTSTTALSSTTVLTTGNYYASQTVNGVESTRTVVAITVNTTSAPTALAQTFCNAATVADLTATGSNLNWYANLSGGTALTASTALATATYYVSQTVNSCESTRTLVVVTVNPTSVAGSASATSATVCSGSGTTIYLSGNTGTIQWQSSLDNSAFANLLGQTASTYTATNLTATTYYRAVVTSGVCSSVSTSSVTISITPDISSAVLSTISGPATATVGANITLSISIVPGATSYVWDLPSGMSISSISNGGATVIVAVADNFAGGIVSVKATNSCGSSAWKTKTYAAPATFGSIAITSSYTGAPVICGGATNVPFAVTTTAGASYLWNLPTGVSFSSGSIATTSSVNLDFASNYEGGTISATRSTATSTITGYYTVGALATPANLNGPTVLCGITSATYAVASVNNASSYEWSLPSGMTITSGSGTVSIQTSFSGVISGSVRVRAIRSCGYSAWNSISVGSIATPSSISGPTRVCGAVVYTIADGVLTSAAQTSLNYSVTEVAGMTYTWSVPTGMTIASGQGTSAIVVTVVPANFTSGQITVTAASTSSPTCISSVRTLNISKGVSTITGPTTICNLTSATYSVPSASGSAFTWSVPTWMTIVSGQGTNEISVTMSATANSAQPMSVAITTNCGVQEVSTSVGCGLYTQLANTYCGSTLSNINAGFLANNVAGTSMYGFLITYNGQSYTVDSTDRLISLSEATTMPLLYNTTYAVSVRLKLGNQWCNYGIACNITTPSMPLTGLDSTYCGSTLSNINAGFLANNVAGASEYQFSIVYGGYTYTVLSPDRLISLSEATTMPLLYGATYAISVRVRIGSQWGEYSTSCNVTTPSTIPTTSLDSTYCGSTLSNINAGFLATNIPSASQYEFTIVYGGSSYVVSSTDRLISLSEASGMPLVYGATYAITVRVKIGSQWSEYSTSCTVTTPSVPTTSLDSTYCGSTLSNINAGFLATNIAGANQYEFTVSNGSTPYTVLSSDRLISLSEAVGMSLLYSTTYSVSVKVRIGEQWSISGASCTITTPSVPLTSLDSTYCGHTLSSVNAGFLATNVAGANLYSFSIVYAGQTYVVESADRLISLSEAVGMPLVYGATYSVSVRVRIGSQWGNYGSVCTVATTTNIPTTNLQNSQCDYTAISSTEIIYATLVTNATSYRFSFTNSSNFGYIFDSISGSFGLDTVPGLTSGTTYSVKVSMLIGGIWGAYGKSCTLTTPSTAKTEASSSLITSFDATAYPNPFASNFKLDIKTSNEATLQVKVYDMLGKLIENRILEPTLVEGLEVGANYPSGVYNVIVSQGDNVKTLRVIKR